MNYELWSLSSRNVVADFETEAAALQAVAVIVRQQGRDAALDLLLGVEDDVGRSHGLLCKAKTWWAVLSLPRFPPKCLVQPCKLSPGISHRCKGQEYTSGACTGLRDSGPWERCEYTRAVYDSGDDARRC